jgi:hypothetical protein
MPGTPSLFELAMSALFALSSLDLHTKLIQSTQYNLPRDAALLQSSARMVSLLNLVQTRRVCKPYGIAGPVSPVHTLV